MFKRGKKKAPNEVQVHEEQISENDIQYLRQKAEKSFLTTFGIVSPKGANY
jgi:hypothetical protein